MSRSDCLLSSAVSPWTVEADELPDWEAERDDVGSGASVGGLGDGGTEVGFIVSEGACSMFGVGGSARI